MKKEFLLSLLISLTFLSLGMLLLHYEYIGYGLSFFVFLPFVLGYLLGGESIKKASVYGFFLSLIIFCVLLLLGELEGLVCILMAMPLVGTAGGVGVLVKYIQRKRKNDGPNQLKSTVIPLVLFFTIGFIETKLTQNKIAIVAVSSSVRFQNSPLEVYNAIKSVDTLDAQKPFLLQLDLPVPQKCILEEEKVGGIRTCYFEGGLIVERITELRKGEILRMDVIDYQLTGRKWLQFKEAIYTFKETTIGTCEMTRITTYGSELYPRFYWQPLEEIGIEQEHEYVFRNLQKDLITP